MKHTVFISHSVKDNDQEVANLVYDYLDKNEIKCFMDTKDLVPGISFPEQITTAIKESRVVVLVFSANSDSSKNVQNEVAIASDSKVPIITLRIENTMPMKLAFFIMATQWLDAFPPPVKNHLPKLLDAIKQLSDSKQEDKPPTGGWIKDDRIKDDRWHDIDRKDLSPWALKRIKELDSGKQISGQTFMYRRNRYTGKYERRLKPKR
jgi:hypothetical protein